LNRADRLDLALVSLSSPLGVELLPAAEAAPLLEAYHLGALALPEGFGAWAAACVAAPDPAALGGWLDAGCVGLQLPATALADRAGYARCEPLLRVLEEREKPLFVHPGPAASPDAPAWWAANVDYVHQMHTAYHALAAFGRAAHPTLKVCFALLGGLAPAHRERAAARGGPDVDAAAWFETSSYGPLAVAAVGAALDAAGHAERIVLGSDRPYAAPTELADELGAERATAGLLGRVFVR
jgi:6-methylsalicylate decarboxylase